jgi:low affinity Fe/Cu permease
MIKKFIYGTILLFVFIMIVVIIWAVNTPIKTVKYENGAVVEETE